MSMFDRLLGNASEINVEKLGSDLDDLLTAGEKPEKAFVLYRDFFVFTNRRLILVDKQGMTGKKVEYHSIPYTSISHFSVETAGHFDRDAEMKIYIGSERHPIERQFKKGSDIIIGVQKTLAHYVLGLATQP